MNSLEGVFFDFLVLLYLLRLVWLVMLLLSRDQVLLDVIRLVLLALVVVEFVHFVRRC